jgi:hypothetical protein
MMMAGADGRLIRIEVTTSDLQHARRAGRVSGTTKPRPSAASLLLPPNSAAAAARCPLSQLHAP